MIWCASRLALGPRSEVHKDIACPPRLCHSRSFQPRCLSDRILRSRRPNVGDGAIFYEETFIANHVQPSSPDGYGTPVMDNA